MLIYGNTAPDAELVVLYGNCQILFLAHQLAVADPHSRGYLCMLNYAPPGSDIDWPQAEALSRCKLYLEQYEYLPPHGVRAQLRDALLPQCPRLVFPPLVLEAPWPFGTNDARLPPDERFVWGRYPIGDAIGMEVAAMGLDADAAVAKYMSLSRERMPDLRHVLEHNFARIEHRDQSSDVVIGDHVRAHFRERHLFWTTGHVSKDLIIELGQRLYMACVPLLKGDPAWGLEHLRSSLDHHPGMGDVQLPVHPDVAQVLGLNWCTPDLRYRWYDQQWTFEEYLRRYLTGDTSW
jgi:hypothetical protein